MVQKPRRFRRAFARWLLIAATAYLGVCGIVAWKKDTILFPSHGRERAAGRVAPAGFDTWWQTMRDGTRVEGWWLPANDASAARPAPAVIVFHGNGELIDDSRDFAEAWHKIGVNVLLVEYRGYGRSDGRPEVTACLRDSAEWYDRVVTTPGVRSDVVLAHGFSLGGIFAAELARVRPLAGLALESTVASLAEAAHDRRVWILFTRERFDPAEVLRGLPAGVPVLLTHGRADNVVPFRHQALLAAARPEATVVIGIHDHFPLAAWQQPALLGDLLKAAVARADSQTAKSMAKK